MIDGMGSGTCSGALVVWIRNRGGWGGGLGGGSALRSGSAPATSPGITSLARQLPRPIFYIYSSASAAPLPLRTPSGVQESSPGLRVSRSAATENPVRGSRKQPRVSEARAPPWVTRPKISIPPLLRLRRRGDGGEEVLRATRTMDDAGARARKRKLAKYESRLSSACPDVNLVIYGGLATGNLGRR